MVGVLTVEDETAAEPASEVRIGRTVALLATTVTVALCFASRPVRPVWDAAEYLSASRDFGLFFDDPPTRYTPGWPVLLSPFSAVGLEDLAPRLAAVALVVGVVVLAFRLGGWNAAAVAALVVAASPFYVASSRHLMSDGPSAALTVWTATAVHTGRNRAAGLLAGFGVWVRLSAVASLVALVVAGRRRAAVVGVAAVIPMLLFNSVAYGAPWRTGYDVVVEQTPYAASYIVEPWGSDGFGAYADDGLSTLADDMNRGRGTTGPSSLHVYAGTLFGWSWVYAPPFFCLFALRWLWKNRAELIARFVGVTTGVTILTYVPYFYWSQRFVASPGALLVAVAAAGCVAPSTRGLVTSRR